MAISIICVYQFLTASHGCGRRSDSSDCLERIRDKGTGSVLFHLPSRESLPFILSSHPLSLSPLPSPSPSPLLPSGCPSLPQPPLSPSVFLHLLPLHLPLSFPFSPLHFSALKLVSKSGCPCSIHLTTFNLKWEPGRLDPPSFQYNQRLCTSAHKRDLPTHL